jgi:hypothetical protein|nr:MAG TPA: hypothetical protein [Caudoviricetes sp.]
MPFNESGAKKEIVGKDGVQEKRNFKFKNIVRLVAKRVMRYFF